MSREMKYDYESFCLAKMLLNEYIFNRHLKDTQEYCTFIFEIIYR